MRRLVVILALLALVGCADHLTAPRKFSVFFLKDQSELTPEGQAVVAQIAQNAGSQSPSKIVVEGRSDGGTPHDATLADERATVVLRALTNSGVSPTALEKRQGAPPTGVTGTAAHEVLVEFLP